MLKTALADNARTINEEDADILALMNEIEHGASLIDPETISDPLPPLMAEGTPTDHLHTIPHTESLPKSSPPIVNENKDE